MKFCPDWVGKPGRLSVVVAVLAFPAIAAPEGGARSEGAAKPVENAKPAEVPVPLENTGDAKPDAGESGSVAVAKPVTGDLVQVYGWREVIQLDPANLKLRAKLDTGALTSSIHAEEKELFERDGKKWVRFIVLDPTQEHPVRHKMEAPLVRIARIKEPGAASVAREVVRLSFQIGGRKARGEFTLNNRSNMNAPVLLGRTIVKDLGWVDSSRTDLADEKLFR